MARSSVSPGHGLYDPRDEHDACGFGFVVDVEGRASRSIVRDALRVLHNLEHRGASGSERDTGDGAGILTQIPHAYLYRRCEALGFALPGPGDYAVGMVFLPATADRPPSRGSWNRPRPRRASPRWAGATSRRTEPSSGRRRGAASR